MEKVEFYKLQASGNDFILLDARRKPQGVRQNYKNFAKKYCERRLGIGADGLLIIEFSKIVSFKMRVFNPDGSEAEMCGNGARCAALWAVLQKKREKKMNNVKFETKAGVIESQVKAKDKTAEVRIKMIEPFGLKFDLPIKVFGRGMRINFINTGVPHAIIFVEGIDKIDVENIGRAVRFCKRFKPAGTNVDFVEANRGNSIKIRTYERGVEAETLACGTGCAAGAIITNCKLKSVIRKNSVKVFTKSRESLKVYFNRNEAKVSDVWLEGKARLVYKGILKGNFPLNGKLDEV